MEGFYPELKDDPAWDVRVMNCGHDQMVDAPDEVAEILIQAAASANQNHNKKNCGNAIHNTQQEGVTP